VLRSGAKGRLLLCLTATRGQHGSSRRGAPGGASAARGRSRTPDRVASPPLRRPWKRRRSARARRHCRTSSLSGSERHTPGNPPPQQATRHSPHRKERRPDSHLHRTGTPLRSRSLRSRARSPRVRANARCVMTEPDPVAPACHPEAGAATGSDLAPAKDNEQSLEPAGIRRLLARESGRIALPAPTVSRSRGGR
jgi:hypothetical protein